MAIFGGCCWHPFSPMMAGAPTLHRRAANQLERVLIGHWPVRPAGSGGSMGATLYQPSKGGASDVTTIAAQSVAAEPLRGSKTWGPGPPTATGP